MRAVAALCAAVIGLIVSTVPAADAAAVKRTKYGTFRRFKNINYDHAVVAVRVSAPRREPNTLLPIYATRPKHGRLVYIHINAVGVKGDSSMNPLYFEVITPHGSTVNCDLGEVRHQLGSRGLHKHEKSHGNVAFHLAKHQNIAKIAFTDAAGHPVGYWHH